MGLTLPLFGFLFESYDTFRQLVVSSTGPPDLHHYCLLPSGVLPSGVLPLGLHLQVCCLQVCCLRVCCLQVCCLRVCNFGFVPSGLLPYCIAFGVRSLWAARVIFGFGVFGLMDPCLYSTEHMQILWCFIDMYIPLVSPFGIGLFEPHGV